MHQSGSLRTYVHSTLASPRPMTSTFCAHQRLQNIAFITMAYSEINYYVIRIVKTIAGCPMFVYHHSSFRWYLFLETDPFRHRNTYWCWCLGVHSGSGGAVQLLSDTTCWKGYQSKHAKNRQLCLVKLISPMRGHPGLPVSRLEKLSISLMMTSSNGNIFRVTGPLCGEFTGPGEFPSQRPVTRSFDVSLDLRLNKQLSKQPWGWWFETPSWSLWRQCNVPLWPPAANCRGTH